MQTHRLIHGLDDTFLKALGEVIAYWGYFDAWMDDVLDMLRVLPEARALSESVPSSFKERSRLLLRTVRLCFADSPSLVAKYEALIQRAKIASVQRNRLMHASWIASRSEHMILSWHKGVLKPYTVTLSDLQALANDLHDLHIKFLRLTRTVDFEPAPLLTPEEFASWKAVMDRIAEARPPKPYWELQQDALGRPDPPSFREP